MRQEIRALKLAVHDLLVVKLDEFRRSLSLRVFIIIAFATLVSLGVLNSLARQGWQSLTEDLSINIAASTVVAATAIVGFVIGTRRRAFVRILNYQRLECASRETERVQRLNQGKAVVAQLRDRRQPAFLLIEATDASGRAAFLRELVAVLTEQSIIAILVPSRALLENQVGQAALEEFRRMLSLAAVPEAPLARTLESLAHRRNVVVIIDGLDETDHQVTTRSGADIVSTRVDELRVSHLPFVALVEPGAVPHQLLTCRLTLSPVSGAAIHALANPVSRKVIRPTRSVREALQLAAALRCGYVTLREIEQRLISSRSPSITLSLLVSELKAKVGRYGPLAVHISPLLDVGMLGFFWPGRKMRHQPDTLVALGEIANRLARHDSKRLDWADLTAALPSNQVDCLLSGVNKLEAIGLIERVVQYGRIYLRFCEPELRELVVGIWAAKSSLPFGYTAVRSMTAFSGEALQRMLTARWRAGKVWHSVMELAATRGWLVPVNDVACALAGFGSSKKVRLSTSWLAETWERATDRERVAFVQRLPETLPREVTKFLWNRLVPPAFAATAHPVRRVIARQLSGRGAWSWTHLAKEWHDLVRIAEEGGLAWFERKGPIWHDHGSAVASLCWVLPSITLTCHRADSRDVERLLTDLATAVTPGSGPERSPAPDLGIEISLAEGLKDLCNLSLVRHKPLPVTTWDLIEMIALRGRSWVSHLLALQAAGLAVASDPQHTPRFFALCSNLDFGQHPLVHEYAQIIAKAITEHGTDFDAMVRTVVWEDDTEMLETAGGELADDATRILGMMTLILNLAEARILSGGDWQAEQFARVSALVKPHLPRCLTSPVLANAFGRVECVCSLRLCGSDLSPTSRRPISRVFAYRCLSALPQQGSRPSLQLAKHWQSKALATHLLRLARQP